MPISLTFNYIIFACDPNGQKIESVNLIFLRSVSCLDITLSILHFCDCSLYKSCRVFIRLNKSIKNVKTSVYGVAIKNVKTSFYGVSYQ